jgi:hypothetical protein
MSASLTKRLKAMADAEGTVDAASRAVRVAISEGQPDTAYELARGLAHMVRNGCGVHVVGMSPADTLCTCLRGNEGKGKGE